MNQGKSKIHFAWFVLIGICITVGLGKAGINNIAGLFVSPVAQDLGISVGNLTLYLSVSAVVTMIFLPIGGKIMAKFDVRFVLIIAIILQAGSFAMFGFMNSVWGWYIFAIPMAVGGVFVTVIAGPVLIERWFSKRKGIALGVMTAIAGLLGVFVQPVAGNLISGMGWRTSYYVIGIAIMIIVVPTILFLLRQSPKDKGLLPYGMEDDARNNSEGEQEENGGIAFTDAKKSFAFLLLAVFFFIVTAVSSFSTHIPNYLVSQGYDVSFAGSAMSAMMVGVFVGSLLFGYLSDRIGAKGTSLIAMVTGLVSIILLLLFPNSVTMIVLGLVLFGFMTASIGTLAPALTSSLFGGRDYSQIYSTASMGLALASIVALPAYGYIFDLTGSYVSGFYTIIVMLIINIVAIIIAFKNKNKMIEKGMWH